MICMYECVCLCCSSIDPQNRIHFDRWLIKHLQLRIWLNCFIKLPSMSSIGKGIIPFKHVATRTGRDCFRGILLDTDLLLRYRIKTPRFPFLLFLLVGWLAPFIDFTHQRPNWNWIIVLFSGFSSIFSSLFGNGYPCYSWFTLLLLLLYYFVLVKKANLF